MTEPIEIINRWNHKVIVSYDDYDYEESPRNRVDGTKLCFKEIRDYSLPNELDFDFNFEDNLEEMGINDFDELSREYRVFSVSVYIHWGISVRLTHLDRAQLFEDIDDWFIAIPKKDYFMETEAIKRAEQEIGEYDQWIRWDIYRWDIYRIDTRINQTTWESKEDDTYIEWCGYFFDKEECRKDALDQIRNFIS